GDWNFCADEKLQPTDNFFPQPASFSVKGDQVVQIAAGGPDSDLPTVLFSMMQAINHATEEILITTPYFIPGESMLNALVIAAARSYYDELLEVGVEVYLYRKGFVHAKTLVSDRKIAIVGTANMDFRSFDLNFEVNAMVYSREAADELRAAFYEDIKDAEKID